MIGLAGLARGLARRAVSVALRDLLRIAVDERGVATVGGSMAALMRRVRVLGTDPSTGFNAVEGLGGVRLERMLGREIRRSADDSFDFVDDVLGNISLKGSLPVVVRGNAEGLANSVANDIMYSSSASTVAVDISGLTPEGAALVEERAAAALSEMSLVKKVVYLR